MFGFPTVCVFISKKQKNILAYKTWILISLPAFAHVHSVHAIFPPCATQTRTVGVQM